ncbi:MAG: hypothetical protein GC183_02305 [Thiobacillus sp.]|nr:hypothetical protein [Thiobacillus sp.]
MSRRLFPPWLFVLALLWGQASAYAHALGHLKDSASSKHAHVCELCVAQTNLGSAAPSATHTLHLSSATYDWFVAVVCPEPSPRLSAPRARAPPASL